MESVGAPAGVPKVVLPAKLSLRGQLDTAVIEEAIGSDLVVILQGTALWSMTAAWIPAWTLPVLTMKPVMYVPLRSCGWKRWYHRWLEREAVPSITATRLARE